MWLVVHGSSLRPGLFLDVLECHVSFSPQGDEEGFFRFLHEVREDFSRKS